MATFDSNLSEVYPALLRSATVLCWSLDDVEDVVQETVLRGFRSYGSFRRESTFLTWMYVILLRVAGSANRQRRRRVPLNYRRDQPDQLPPVDRAVIDDEQARSVIDAIRSLPQRQREMVTLHFIDDLSYPQIAEGLGVAVGTVKATVFAAKASLREALATSDPKPR